LAFVEANPQPLEMWEQQLEVRRRYGLVKAYLSIRQREQHNFLDSLGQPRIIALCSTHIPIMSLIAAHGIEVREAQSIKFASSSSLI
jgi:hypothetical protein